MGTRRISFAGQVEVYVGKCFRLFVAEKQWKNLLSSLIIVVLISIVTSEDMFRTFKDTKNGAFAFICACVWIGLFNSIQSICRERAIIKREHRTGLKIPAYITAHVIYELVLCAAETIIIVSAMILRNASHLPPEGLLLGVVVDYYITMLLVVFGSDMLALLISCIVRNENSAMTVMPFILIIQLIMSGAVFELKGFAEYISYGTLSKWGLAGLCAVANTDKTVRSENKIMMPDMVYEDTPEYLLKCWGILLLFIIIYILFAMLILSGVDKDER